MKELKRDELVKVVVLIEFSVIVLTFILSYFFKIDILSKIIITVDNTLIALVATLILLISNIIAVFVLPKYITLLKSLREAYDEVSALVVEADIPSIIAIALISGFAEELLFRGILQPLLGIVFASLIFGFLHVGNKKLLSYGIYAVFIGYYLGSLLIFTGSLWPPILVHILNNAFAVPFMKRNYYKLQELKIKEQEG